MKNYKVWCPTQQKYHQGLVTGAFSVEQAIRKWARDHTIWHSGKTYRVFVECMDGSVLGMDPAYTSEAYTVSMADRYTITISQEKKLNHCKTWQPQKTVCSGLPE